MRTHAILDTKWADMTVGSGSNISGERLRRTEPPLRRVAGEELTKRGGFHAK